MEMPSRLSRTQKAARCLHTLAEFALMLVLMLMSGGRQQTSEMASASANRIRREARLRVPRAVVTWRWLSRRQPPCLRLASPSTESNLSTFLCEKKIRLLHFHLFSIDKKVLSFIFHEVGKVFNAQEYHQAVVFAEDK